MKKRVAIVGILLAVAIAVGAPLKFSRIAPSADRPNTNQVVNVNGN